MRIQSQLSDPFNSINSRMMNKNMMRTGPAGNNPVRVTGSASQMGTVIPGATDGDVKTSVRKQMQDQLRNLFEKERAKTSPFLAENNDQVNGTDKEEEEKKDKLLESGKVYNFKEVSNKIMRAKTSISAGQAVVAAKRKVSELKRKLAASGGDDELQMALTHARKMEVVAERKKNNLTLEEMVKNTQKRDEILEKMEKKGESPETQMLEELKDKVMDRQLEHIDEQADIQREEAERMQEKMQEEMAEKIEASEEEMMEQMSSFVEEMSDKESEMLREMSEMLDAMETVDPHMSEEALDKLKLKHRLSEQKSLMKADMEYLKDMYKHIDGRNASSMPGANPSGASFGPVSSFGSMMPSVGSMMPSVDAGMSTAPEPSVDVAL